MNIFNREPKHRSATDAVRFHLNKYGSINQRQCLDKYGSWRLSRIIYDLKEQGLNIRAEYTKVKTQYDYTTRIATYYLEK